MSKILMPKRIVLAENTTDSENLLVERPTQVGFAKIGYTTLKKGGFVLLDFGREIRGGIILSARSVSSFPAAAKCRIVFGESVMEALSKIGEKNATNDHAIRDTVIDVPNMGCVHFGNTGYRFFKIEALDSDIVIKSIKASLDTLDITEKGSFSSSDERLNEIWRVGAYTVYLNMGEYIWDGVKRDRLVWLGDMHPETKTVYSVYGNHPSIKNSLELIKNETPATEWINTIPSYSFWWVINQYEWYMQTGDEEYLREQIDYITTVLKRALKVAKENPIDNFKFFVDWSSTDDFEAKRIGFYAVMYKAFVCGKAIAKQLSLPELLSISESGLAAINALSLTVPNQKQMAGISVFSGLADAREINEKVLSREPLKDLSAFMGYYVLLARGEAGDVSGALDVIRSYWGAMLDLGATTFFEDFDIRWIENAARIDEIVPEGKVDVHGDYGKYCYKGFRHSLCHGWSSGPIGFLTEYVLGIRITEPGCKEITISPNLADLEWVKGVYPTPFGNVYIEHRLDRGKIISDVRAPKEVKIKLIK